MSDERDDGDLRERFRRLRRDEEAAAPGFAHSVTRARARHGSTARRRLLIPVAVGALGAAALALWLAAPSGTPQWTGGTGELSLGTSVGAWRTPTDVLLDTPGSELLRTLPDFGSSELAPDPPTSHTKRRSHA